MQRKLIFLLIALLGVTCFVLVGFSLGLRSPWGGVLSLFAAIMVIGFGFKMKKKWREQDEAKGNKFR